MRKESAYIWPALTTFFYLQLVHIDLYLYVLTRIWNNLVYLTMLSNEKGVSMYMAGFNYIPFIQLSFQLALYTLTCNLHGHFKAFFAMDTFPFI